MSDQVFSIGQNIGEYLHALVDLASVLFLLAINVHAHHLLVAHVIKRHRLLSDQVSYRIRRQIHELRTPHKQLLVVLTKWLRLQNHVFIVHKGAWLLYLACLELSEAYALPRLKYLLFRDFDWNFLGNCLDRRHLFTRN